MIRDAILDRVRPLVEEFAGELAELLAQDFERRIGQLGEAFAVATSAFAAELAGDQEAVRDVGSLRPRLVVPEAAIVAEQASTSSDALTSKGKPRERAVMKCKKCGRPGTRSDGCGTSHTPLTSPAPDAETASTPPRKTAASAPATSTVQPPPPLSSSEPAIDSLRSNKPPHVAPLPSARAANEPPPSFDAAQDRREELADLSFLTLRRKTSF